jgi:hypothetical protein
MAPSARKDRRNNNARPCDHRKRRRKLRETTVQLSRRHIKFHRFATAAIVFLFGSVAFLHQGKAGNLANDPNALSKIREFIDKPPPEDLILKPKKKKKQAHSGEN